MLPVMETPGAMLLNLQMLADPMDELLWDFHIYRPGESPSLRSCQLYWNQQELQEDVLYVVPESRLDHFPADDFCYMTTGIRDGDAPHIHSIGAPFADVLNLVLNTFQRYHDFENQLNTIIAHDGSLTELCCAASDFFHNPVYIHDEMFSVIAHSSRVEGMLEFEYNAKTNKLHIPLWLIEEFKYDESYKSTLLLHEASIWGNEEYPFNIRSLFVNIWDGYQYCGRLLINEIGSSLMPGQFRAAEYLAGYIMILLRHMRQNKNHRYRNFEETLIALIENEEVDERDLYTILRILDWSEQDLYLCLKLQNQDRELAIRSDSALHSALSSQLQESAIFRYQQDLYIIVNLEKTGLHHLSLRQQLAPHIRDSCMYCGISNPVNGIRAIQHGFFQADIALKHIVRENSSNWIVPFSDCTLSYICKRACVEMPDDYLMHPVVLDLMTYDKCYGTRYYETLRTYLICERDIPRTAEELFIHRTTLTYRLKKMQELVKLNLNDPQLRLHLLLSFHIRDMAAEEKRHRSSKEE